MSGRGTIHPDPLVSRPDKNQIFFKNKRKPKTKKNYKNICITQHGIWGSGNMTFLNFKGGHIPLTQTRQGGGLLICRYVIWNTGFPFGLSPALKKNQILFFYFFKKGGSRCPAWGRDDLLGFVWKYNLAMLYKFCVQFLRNFLGNLSIGFGLCKVVAQLA